MTPANNTPRGEAKIKRPNTSPDTDHDKKRPQKSQNEQGGEDEKGRDISESNNNQNENDATGVEDVKMRSHDERDRAEGTQNIDSERVKATEINADA